MREKPRDKGRLQHILQAIDNVEEFRQGINFEEFKQNKLVFYAIVKNLRQDIDNRMNVISRELPPFRVFVHPRQIDPKLIS